MSYLERQQSQYQEILGLINKTIASGGDIESVRKILEKRIKELDQILEHR